jgi:hypothetical protein
VKKAKISVQFEIKNKTSTVSKKINFGKVNITCKTEWIRGAEVERLDRCAPIRRANCESFDLLRCESRRAEPTATNREECATSALHRPTDQVSRSNCR